MNRRIRLLLCLPLLASCDDDSSSAAAEEAVEFEDGDGDGFRARKDNDDWKNGDCDDEDASIYPGADEIPYDGIDQDCSGSDLTDIDRDGIDGNGGGDCDDTRTDISPLQVDVCGDGIDQDCSGSDQACDDVDGDGDGVSGADGDCNDANPNVYPGAGEVAYNGVDDDCDLATLDDDLDGDGVNKNGGGDCNDEDPTIFPGAEELPYDGIDQDCSGVDLVDIDADGVPGGPGGADCDDRRADVGPSEVDVCGDGIDQDCSGADQSCEAVDRDGDGDTALDGDCNDADAAISPSATEIPYNGVDDDCDPVTPDDDLDGDHFGQLWGGDCDDNNPDIHPGAEELPYDGVDQDCSGSDLVDIDGDGYAGGAGGDCNDARPDVHPGAFDYCGDGVDQDCSGTHLDCQNCDADLQNDPDNCGACGNTCDSGVCSAGVCTRTVFLTDYVSRGNAGGVAGIDAQCQAEADAAGLVGSFVGWVSDDSTSPVERFVRSSDPYVRPDGVVVANDWADLVDGTLAAPIRLNAFGAFPDSVCGVSDTRVLTATETDGTRTAHNCANFTSSNSVVMSGNAARTSGDWTAVSLAVCNVTLHCGPGQVEGGRFYCFQQ